MLVLLQQSVAGVALVQEAERWDRCELASDLLHGFVIYPIHHF